MQRLAELRRRELQARLDHLGVFFDGKPGIPVEIVDDPALALGDDLVAELLRRQFVSPLAECAFGELLDVALVNDRHGLAIVLQGVLDRHADQALGAGDGDRLDADARVLAHPLVGARQHLVVDEVDQLLRLRRALLPLDAGVNVFRVLAEDDDVHALGMLHRRRDALVILHRADAGIEVEDLAQGDVQRANAAADGRGQRALDADAQLAKRGDGVVGQPGLEAVHGFFAGENFIPGHPTLAVVGDLDSGVEYAHRRFPDVAAGAVTFDERDDGIVRDDKLTVFVSDLGSAGGQSNSVIRSRHEAPQGVWR